VLHEKMHWVHTQNKKRQSINHSRYTVEETRHNLRVHGMHKTSPTAVYHCSASGCFLPHSTFEKKGGYAKVKEKELSAIMIFAS
jgi:hypothetical protein